MPAKPEPTRAQRDKLSLIRREFGSQHISKTYRMDRKSGDMIVKARCQAGVWVWAFDPDGQLKWKTLQTELQLEGTDDNRQRPSTLPSGHYHHDNA